MPRLLELQRQEAYLGGQRGQIIQKIAEVDEQSGENQMQMMNLKNQQMGDVMKDLQDVQTKRFDTLDRIQAARDLYKRLRGEAHPHYDTSLHTLGGLYRDTGENGKALTQ